MVQYTQKTDFDNSNWLDHWNNQGPVKNILAEHEGLIQQHNLDSLSYRGVTSCIDMGRRMALEVSELTNDPELIGAGFLYPFYLSSEKAQKIIREQHAPLVRSLLAPCQKIEWIYQQNAHERHVDQIRPAVLAMAGHIWVVCLKLTEQVIWLSLLKNIPEEQEKAAQNGLYIFAPLANYLGLGTHKSALEDLSLRYLDPTGYREISKGLQMRRTDREEYVIQVKEELSDLLEKSTISTFDISGRAKHIYSIYKKTKRKDVTLEKIYDTTALRILVPTVSDCYEALSAIQGRWTPIPEEFDDYVSHPKKNGYQSIHTALIGPSNKTIEIQIRTFEMHETSEFGVAAHWRYKEEKTGEADKEDKMTVLRQLIAWQGAQQDVDSKHLYQALFEDQVHVFTPTGDLITLSQGATPLDFAYHIHTEVGHRCCGAKVNGAMVPLTYTLENGDQIEVVTAKNHQPSRDWIITGQAYLKTARAKQKVQHWFKQQRYDEYCDHGQQLWTKACKKEKIPPHDLQKALKFFHFKTEKDLLAAIGSGQIGTETLLNRLTEHTEKKTEPTIKKQKPAPTKQHLDDADNMLMHVARCCFPLPGDPVIGYITQGRGVTVHHTLCRNVQHAKKHKPERLMPVQWGAEKNQPFITKLQIITVKEKHAHSDIVNYFHQQELSIIDSHIHPLKKSEHEILLIECQFATKAQLQQVTTDLKKKPYVIEVKRTR